MSDEQQRRDDAGRGGSDPDETRAFDPSAPAESQPDDGPRSGDPWVFDRTEQMPRAEQRPADGTQPMPPVGADGLPLGSDATSVIPPVGSLPAGSDATSVMPPAAGLDETAAGAGNPAWSGRAEVRPPQPAPSGDFAGDWDGVPPSAEPRGKWWLPIVIGIVILLLLALLGWGVWLIVQSSDKDDDSPAPAATTSAAAPETTTTTTAATTEPTTAATTTEAAPPAEVTIPALKGLSSAEARRALDRRGLAYRLRFVTTNDAPAGTVIDSDPAEGQQVPSDTTVTLIIASAPSTKPTTAATTPTTTAPTDTNDQGGD